MAFDILNRRWTTLNIRAASFIYGARMRHVPSVMPSRNGSTSSVQLVLLLPWKNVLNWGDNMGVRYALPTHMIEVEMDQEAFDFIKWYTRTYTRQLLFGWPFITLSLLLGRRSFSTTEASWTVWRCVSHGCRFCHQVSSPQDDTGQGDISDFVYWQSL